MDSSVTSLFTFFFLLFSFHQHALALIVDGLLPNGNFEYAPKKSEMNGTIVMGRYAIPNWEISGFVEYIESGHKQGDMLLVVPEGAYAVRLGNEAYIKQKVTGLVVGIYYSITFSAARTCAQAEKLNVTVAPDSGVLPMQTIYSSDGWDSYAWAFQSDFTEAEIIIHNPGVEEDPACGPLIDSVAIRTLYPPEPTNTCNLVALSVMDIIGTTISGWIFEVDEIFPPDLDMARHANPKLIHELGTKGKIEGYYLASCCIPFSNGGQKGGVSMCAWPLLLQTCSCSVFTKAQEDDLNPKLLLALKTSFCQPLKPENLLKNGGFEEGPYVFPNTTWGVLIPPNIEDDHSPLPGWMIESLKAVRYIDSDHYLVPQGRRAVELVAGKESAIAQVVRTVPGRNYVLTFAVGDANNKCEGSMIVEAFADRDTIKVPYESKGTGGFKRAELRFVAVSARTRIMFLSTFYHTRIDAALCGPTIDDVKLLSMRTVPHKLGRIRV